MEILTDYFVDPEKRLFHGDQFICTLKKHPFAIRGYNDRAFLIDMFGDCYELGDSPRFLFGILGLPLFFRVHDDAIYTADTHGRLWVCELDGRVRRIIFTGAPILGVMLVNTITGMSMVVAEDETRTLEDPYESQGAAELEKDFNTFLFDVGKVKKIRVFSAAGTLLGEFKMHALGKVCETHICYRLLDKEQVFRFIQY